MEQARTKTVDQASAILLTLKKKNGWQSALAIQKPGERESRRGLARDDGEQPSTRRCADHCLLQIGTGLAHGSLTLSASAASIGSVLYPAWQAKLTAVLFRQRHGTAKQDRPLAAKRSVRSEQVPELGLANRQGKKRQL